jgi:hypothetical protein
MPPENGLLRERSLFFTLGAHTTLGQFDGDGLGGCITSTRPIRSLTALIRARLPARCASAISLSGMSMAQGSFKLSSPQGEI